MPIVVVALQPRGIQAQHQPRLPEANLGNQPLEAAAAVARRTGLPEVVINDLNPFLGPAEQGCTIDQPILQLGALLMLTDLAGGRLAHVKWASLARCAVVTGLSKLSSMFIVMPPDQIAGVGCGQH